MGLMADLVQNETVTDGAISGGGRSGLLGLLMRLRDDTGAVMLEAAFTFMILMTLTLGVVECSMMAYTYAILSDAAREGVHYAAVHGTDSTTCQGPSTGCDSTAANVISDVKTYAQGFSGSLSAMSVAVTYPDGVSTGTSRVTVTITQTYQPVFNIPLTAQTFTASATGRILY